MTPVDSDLDIPLFTPPGFNRGRLLSKINSPSLQTNRKWRWKQCVDDPLLFGLLYFPHLMRSAQTGNQLSLNPLHVDLARYSRFWMCEWVKMTDRRHAWVAPRGSGKSMWAFIILPIWALAFGHRKLVSIFTHSNRQAQIHMDTIRRELDQNANLGNDFPHLCNSTRKTQTMYKARSGAALTAQGIDAQSLGLNVDGNRPDLIIFDDIEPDGGNYGETEKVKRQTTMLQAILGMNDQAQVWWVGTVTMRGSIVDDMVETFFGSPVEWVVQEHVNVHYYEPIITDEEGRERSFWPQRWSLETLRRESKKRMYRYNFLNRPPGAEEGYWSDTDIRIGVIEPEDWVLSIDPAFTKGASSDFTGFAIVAHNYTRATSMVEDAYGRKFSPDELRMHVRTLLGHNPMIHKVLIESNQGGRNWVTDVLTGALPAGVELRAQPTHENKPDRFEELLSWYQDNQVVHAREIPELVRQQLMYPAVKHDDVLDAVDLGVRYFRVEQYAQMRARRR